MGDEADAMWDRGMIEAGREDSQQWFGEKRHPRRGAIRRAVIRRIAAEKRCSLAVAAHTYACKPIAVKRRLCEAEAGRAALSEPRK